MHEYTKFYRFLKFQVFKYVQSINLVCLVHEYTYVKGKNICINAKVKTGVIKYLFPITRKKIMIRQTV